MTIKRMTKIAPALALVALMAACSGTNGGNEPVSSASPAATQFDMDALVKKAQAEGEVSLYAGTKLDATTQWAKKFEDKYGIKVKIYRDGSSTLYQKWAQETAANVNNADVLIQNVYQLMEEAYGKKWITPYKVQNYEAFDFNKLFPPNSDLAGTVYPLYQSIGAVVWNTEVLSDAQQELLRADPIAALADPSFKGMIALADPGGATTTGDYANIILNQGKKYGWDWAEKVAKNKPAAFQSQIPIAAQLIKGEFGVTIATDTVYNEFLKDGVPIEYKFPDPASSSLWMFALPTTGPHPNAARLFMEWATSNEAQDAIYEISQGPGSRIGWKDTRYVNTLPWYSPPEEIYYSSYDPQLQGDKLTAFVKRATSVLGL